MKAWLVALALTLAWGSTSSGIRGAGTAFMDCHVDDMSPEDDEDWDSEEDIASLPYDPDSAAEREPLAWPPASGTSPRSQRRALGVGMATWWVSGKGKGSVR